jgi:hypothetical protein
MSRSAAAAAVFGEPGNMTLLGAIFITARLHSSMTLAGRF